MHNLIAFVPDEHRPGTAQSTWRAGPSRARPRSLLRRYRIRRRIGDVVLLAGLLVLVATVPSFGDDPILRDPDWRAIPMLVTRSRASRNYGTGVIVGRATILTAAHVAIGERMEVRLPYKVIAGRTVCRARYEDVAVVRAELPNGTPYYRLSFRTPAVGEPVRVGGYPGRRWGVTKGRVTHIIRVATLSGRVVRAPMIVFWPALHPGASGAPVLDSRGEVVGIFVASNTRSNYSIAFPNATGLRACRKFVP